MACLRHSEIHRGKDTFGYTVPRSPEQFDALLHHALVIYTNLADILDDNDGNVECDRHRRHF